ncbi:stemmadenine O-acetyltransferase isoform X1 [Spinacia oleracea]|uniref:Stemmadenine O-acetyltransferase isoform X1 n=2 Tax=Spinacia oleracea TaxID=3562 RepID=A0A9R0I7W2_SPIOL|nr:stemmadenine O-acetyltransferase-like isoform X1 [Spinacia oleracea]
MEHEPEVKVKIISKEMVKPSLLPPSHPTTFTLSFLDQTFPVFPPVPLLLLYTASTASTPQGVDIRGLKLSLSQTLDRFYPLAGRLQNESTISCNDEGVPFIETKVNFPLSRILTSPHKFKLLTKFFPSSPDLIPFSIQVNVFLCGGVVIACYWLHKLMDGTSLGTFLTHWAALSNKRFTDLVQPDFDAAVNAFPPLPRTDQDLVTDLSMNPTIMQSNPTIVVLKSFVFSQAALTDLKAKATSERVPKPTRFEALSGFIWEQAFAAATHNLTIPVEHKELEFAVCMRRWLTPPLPRESMGNLFILNVKARADKRSRLQEMVEKIHSSLSNIQQKVTTVYQGENAGDLYLSDLKAGPTEYHEGLFRLSSMCNMGLKEADFGFGKPVSVVRADARETASAAMFRNHIVLTDYSHPILGDGMEAFIYMEEKDMVILESNPHFIALVSPVS